MTPLPGALGGQELVAWRLDKSVHAATWDSGEGSFLYGGRWSSIGRRVVYCALDPSTALVEVAVHLGFDTLGRVPHVLTAVAVADPGDVHVVTPEDIPDSSWLTGGTAPPAQRAFGDDLLDRHPFIVIPSAVSRHSWNLIVSLPLAAGRFSALSQEAFNLDQRLVDR